MTPSTDTTLTVGLPGRSVGVRRVLGRLGRHFWIKALGTPVFMTAFFVAYFHLLRNPSGPVFVMPATALDGWIGFHPAALIPYLSLWFYVSLPTSLLTNLRELVGHAVGASLLGLAGLTAFALWPTTLPPTGIDWSDHPSMGFLKGVDAAGNACPSLHAAFAVFAMLWLDRLLRRLGAGRVARGLNVLWALAILHSTVATRQHVAIDTLAGTLLGWAVAHINLRLCPGGEEPARPC